MYSYEKGFVKTDSFVMDYVKCGNGKKSLVILPGVSMKYQTNQGAAFCKAHEIFLEDFTVYLFDRKRDMTMPYTLFDMARDTKEAIIKLGLKNVYGYGMSQGGMILQIIAGENQGFFEKIALLSSCCKSNENLENISNLWMKYAKDGDYESVNHLVYQNVFSDKFLKKYEKALPILEKDGTQEECDRFYVQLCACKNFDIEKYAEKISCPVFVIGAKGDKVVKEEAIRELREVTQGDLYLYGEELGHAFYNEISDVDKKIFDFFTICCGI